MNLKQMAAGSLPIVITLILSSATFVAGAGPPQEGVPVQMNKPGGCPGGRPCSDEEEMKKPKKKAAKKAAKSEEAPASKAAPAPAPAPAEKK